MPPNPQAQADAAVVGLREPAMLLIQRASCLALIAVTAYCVADYPRGQVLLGLLLSAYAIGLLVQPAIWLLVLPLVLPLVNLAPWSGRFFLEDFDFFIWITLAGGLWHGAYGTAGRPRFTRQTGLLIACLLLTHCIALLRGLWPLAEVDANAFSNYYSRYNALRVGKSLIWAVLLIPPLLRAFGKDGDRARGYLVLGVTLGLIGAGLSILWERGVFVDLLYGKSIYAKISGLTNFSTEYRSTGLFSEMHTGGEAIDGYLSMAWPFALACLAASRTRWQMAVGMVGLPTGLYAAFVTFSRGTYLAVLVSLLTFAAPYSKEFLRRAALAKISWSIPFLLAGMAGVSVLLFERGGFYAMLAALGIMAASMVLVFLRPFGREQRALLMVGLLLAGFALMMRGLATSKWVDNGIVLSFAISLPVSIAALWAGSFIGVKMNQIVSLRGLSVGLAFFVVLVALCVPTLFGSYMKSRFSSTGEDFGGRMAHWAKAVQQMDSGWATQVFGMGLGVFPRAYLKGNDKEKSSVAVLQDDGDNTYLTLSNTMDLAIGQRLNLPAGQSFTLSFDARTQEKNARLSLSICRRNIIEQWSGECVSTAKTVGSAQWQKLEWTFDIGQLGDDARIGRRPLVLRITHFQYNPQGQDRLPLDFVDIDNIAVVDAYGVDHVVNGDFQHGLDSWYSYADHYHLPLHIKQLWVNVYFEQGLLGLAAFCALGFIALQSGLRQAKRGDVFGLALLSSLIGFFAVGLIGTLYDVPRVCFLFFLLLFTLLAQDGTRLVYFGKRPRETQPGTGPSEKRRPSFVQPVQQRA